MIDPAHFGQRVTKAPVRGTFDGEGEQTRAAVARAAARAHPADVAFEFVDPRWTAFYRDLVTRGKLTDWPAGTSPEGAA